MLYFNELTLERAMYQGSLPQEAKSLSSAVVIVIVKLSRYASSVIGYDNNNIKASYNLCMHSVMLRQLKH